MIIHKEKLSPKLIKKFQPQYWIITLFQHICLTCFIGLILKSNILILLMLLQTTIIEQISTKNLVKITLNETQLENNFQAILKALKSHDSCISSLISRVNILENTTKDHESKLGKTENQRKNDGYTSINEQMLKKLAKDTSVNQQ